MLPIAFILAFISTAYALNDWSKPCLGNECAYDIPDEGDKSSGSLKIWSTGGTAISDITPAAGWEVINCDKGSLKQEIRLVCRHEGESDCDHLFSGPGAEGKVVRLPEECGKNAFAHVSSVRDADDQSVPQHIAARLVRRAGNSTSSSPKVKKLAIDADFGSIDSSKHGTINFAIQGANVPGAKDDMTSVGPTVQTRHIHRPRRPGFGFGDIVDGVEDAAGDVVDGAKAAGGAVVDGAKAAGSAVVDSTKTAGGVIADGAEDIVDKGKDLVQDGANAVADGAEAVANGTGKILDAAGDAAGKAGDFINKATKKLNNIDIDKEKDLKPLDFSKTFDILQKKLECGAVEAGVSASAEAKVHVEVSLGVAAQGTLVPPKIEDFAVTATVDGDIDASIDLKASIGGSIDSGKLKIFEIGVPGLDFPGILTIGPSFEITAQALASLELEVDLNVGMKYTIGSAKLVFPPKDGEKSGSFTPGNTPLKLSASPSVKATGTVEAHLIPALVLGINAIDGLAKADVFLNLDASAKAELTVEASAKAEANVNVGNKAGKPSLPAAPNRRSERYVRRNVLEERATTTKTAQEDDETTTSKEEEETTTEKTTEKTAATIAKATTTSKEATTSSKSTSSKGAESSTVRSTSSKTTSVKETSTISSVKSSITSLASLSSTNTNTRTATSKSKSDSLSSSASASASKTQSGSFSRSLSRSSSAPGPSASAKSNSTVDASASAGFGGCFEVSAGLSVNAGATGSFFKIFDKTTSVALFEKNFELFKKCFGNQKRRAYAVHGPGFNKRRIVRVGRAASLALGKFDRRALSCPKEDAGEAKPLADTSVTPS